MFLFRKMTWALIAWTGLMGVWMIGAGSQASGQATDCAGLDAQTCNTASDVGTAIGVTLIGGLWFVGFIVLSLIWFMSRPRSA